MKKVSTLIMGLVATFALASCSGGAVSAEEFAKKCREIEDHTYEKATIKYSIDEDMMVAKDKGSGTIEYTYSPDNGWQTESDDAHGEELKSYLTMNARTFDASEIGQEGQDDMELDVKYYVSPLKVTASGNSNTDTEGTKAKGSLKASVVFDKYGYVVDYKMDMKMEGEAEVMGAKLSMNMYVKDSIKISYK